MAGGMRTARAPARPALEHAEEDRTRLSQKEQEDFLVEAVKRYADLPKGLDFRVELGLLYLKDRRLDTAAAFFKELERPEQKKPYHVLGRFGEAMVLAFRNQPKESNALFAPLLTPRVAEKLSMGQRGLLNRPQFRAMIAEALHQNLANAPSTFPRRMRPYLHPPAATLKTPKRAAAK